MIDVELDPEHYNLAIDRAIQTLRSRSDAARRHPRPGARGMRENKDLGPAPESAKWVRLS